MPVMRRRSARRSPDRPCASYRSSRSSSRPRNEVSDLATKVIGALAEQAIEVQGRIRQLERDLLAAFRSNDLARRIATVPGVGLLGATATGEVFAHVAFTRAAGFVDGAKGTEHADWKS